MYTASTIDQVRSCSAVSVIRRFIKLDKHNKACCPFHGEKTASFNVSQRLQAFKCFGCGVGGDAIAFVMRHDTGNAIIWRSCCIRLKKPNLLTTQFIRYGI